MYHSNQRVNNVWPEFPSYENIGKSIKVNETWKKSHVKNSNPFLNQIVWQRPVWKRFEPEIKRRDTAVDSGKTCVNRMGRPKKSPISKLIQRPSSYRYARDVPRHYTVYSRPLRTGQTTVAPNRVWKCDSWAGVSTSISVHRVYYMSETIYMMINIQWAWLKNTNQRSKISTFHWL